MSTKCPNKIQPSSLLTTQVRSIIRDYGVVVISRTEANLKRAVFNHDLFYECKVSASDISYGHSSPTSDASFADTFFGHRTTFMPSTITWWKASAQHWFGCYWNVASRWNTFWATTLSAISMSTNCTTQIQGKTSFETQHLQLIRSMNDSIWIYGMKIVSNSNAAIQRRHPNHQSLTLQATAKNPLLRRFTTTFARHLKEACSCSPGRERPHWRWHLI